MHIKPLIGTIVGPTSLTRWGQALQLPNAYGVVEVAFEDGGARAAGIHLLSTLSRTLSESPVSLAAVEEKVDAVMEEGVQTILVCVPVGVVIYLVQRGEGDVYLKRGSEFAHLLHNTGAISGEVRIGDTIILASRGFATTLHEDEVKGVFDHLTPIEVAERLTLMLHEKQGGEGSAAIIMQVQEGIEEFIPPTPVRTPKRFHLPLSSVAHMIRYITLSRVRRLFTPTGIKAAVRRVRAHPRKATAVLTALLVALFAVSVILGIWKQSTKVKNEALVAALSDAKHSLDEGVALLSLSPVKGRERLVAAKAILEPFQGKVPARSPEGIELASMYRQITDNLTTAMQVNRVTPELFYDVGLIKKDGKISYMGFEGTTIAMTDRTTQTVYALDVTSKKANVVGGGSLYGSASYTAIHGDKIYVLVDGGVNMVRLGDQKTVPLVVRKTEEWGKIGGMVSFGGNIYLLDTQKSRIWKYVATEMGFSDIREYLNADSLPDLTRATNMSIDGSVWVGTMTGDINKFTQGREDTFIPKGVDPKFGGTVYIYTSDEVKNIYVLDVVGKRVVVLDKDGTYLAQYVWEGAFAPTDLAASESLGKLYLLADTKIYAIALK